MKGPQLLRIGHGTAQELLQDRAALGRVGLLAELSQGIELYLHRLLVNVFDHMVDERVETQQHTDLVVRHVQRAAVSKKASRSA